MRELYIPRFSKLSITGKITNVFRPGDSTNSSFIRSLGSHRQGFTWNPGIEAIPPPPNILPMGCIKKNAR